MRATPERVDLVIRKGFREIAARVRDQARGVAQGRHPPSGAARRGASKQHWSDLVNSIRSGSTSNSPHVSIGSDRVPWALGHEWGSLRFRQFPPVTTEGYILWSTAKGQTEQIMRDMEQAIGEALEEAYPE